MNEPKLRGSRPCSSPHSAPAAWLGPAPAVARTHDPHAEPGTAVASASADVEPLSPEQQRVAEIDDFLASYERIAPEGERRDGWTPFLRKLFLQVVADTGRVSLACEYSGMSRTAAYSLAARDRVFAAGWAAAAHFARQPMADDLYEKAREGITETVTRGDGATVTRHRFDGRLSIAVLNRLDRRCERAEERGSVHLAAVRNWDEFLKRIGEGDDQAAEAILDRPVAKAVEAPAIRRTDDSKERQFCQLPERAFPISLPDPPGWDPADECWKNDQGVWRTTFPPPPGFAGDENVPWDGIVWYERACTAEEAELLDAHAAAAEAAERAELAAAAEARRERFFAGLTADLGRTAGADGPAPVAAQRP